jgi:hypothetical protein
MVSNDHHHRIVGPGSGEKALNAKGFAGAIVGPNEVGDTQVVLDVTSTQVLTPESLLKIINGPLAELDELRRLVPNDLTFTTEHIEGAEYRKCNNKLTLAWIVIQRARQSATIHVVVAQDNTVILAARQIAAKAVKQEPEAATPDKELVIA